MKSLIIGAAGFVGYYLIEELSKNGDELYVTKLPFEKIENKMDGVFDLDITKYQDVLELFKIIQPDRIYHLAAQSSVAVSWKKPQFTVDININGTINILEAIKEVCPNSKILIIGSSEEYGPINLEESINEEVGLNPKNIYALTKSTCEQLGKIYTEAYGLNVIMTRSFNHIGPRQLPQFVIPDFCSQVANIEKGKQEPIIKVGNLSAFRDFTDVRDIVRAYVLLLEKGKSGQVYNVGTGKAIQIKKVLDIILGLSNVDIKVEIDKNKFRPIDIPKIQPNIQKLSEIGWTPIYNINDSIFNILEYFRNKDYE